jgi:hypothetical protein
VISRTQRHKIKELLKAQIARRRMLALPFEITFNMRMHQHGALPGALVIGGQKCGTSSLYAYLEQHPQLDGVISHPSHPSGRWVEKEVHFFQQDEHYERGERWYRAHFHRPQPGVINFEATPDYLTSVRSPNRVHALLPEAKLIVSLRDPVARAFSAYQHTQRLKLSEESFRDALEREFRQEGDRSVPRQNWDFLRKGRYAESLERWFALYPREQFHIINFRDLAENPDETVAGVVAFLGLPPAPLHTGHTHNPGRYSERMDADLETRLREYYEPHNRRLEALLGYPMGW